MSKGLHLKTLEQSRRAFARVINLYHTKQIKSDEFKCYVYGLSKYLEFIKASELDKKYNELNEKIQIINSSLKDRNK